MKQLQGKKEVAPSGVPLGSGGAVVHRLIKPYDMILMDEQCDKSDQNRLLKKHIKLALSFLVYGFNVQHYFNNTDAIFTIIK